MRMPFLEKYRLKKRVLFLFWTLKNMLIVLCVNVNN